MNLHRKLQLCSCTPCECGTTAALEGSTRRQSAFTLIELILVMVILTAAVALSAPKLASFFRGRALDSEARRMLALTRYAQDRAASTGQPTRMWFDPQNSEYGIRVDEIEEQPGDDLRFKLGDGVSLQVQAQTRKSESRTLARALDATSTQAASKERDNLQAIRFLPDGLIDSSTYYSISLTDADNYTLTVAPAQNRLHFEITKGAAK